MERFRRFAGSPASSLDRLPETPRPVLLDGGPEGDWGWSPIDLSNRVAETGQNNTKVVVLLREAVKHAAEPIENKWLHVG